MRIRISHFPDALDSRVFGADSKDDLLYKRVVLRTLLAEAVEVQEPDQDLFYLRFGLCFSGLWLVALGSRIVFRNVKLAQVDAV